MPTATKTRAPRKTASPATPAAQPNVSRLDALRDKLLASVDLLKRRRAGEIDEATIEAYVTLHWMEWHGGSLRLTTTGENLCRHLASLISRTSPRTAN